MDSLTRTFAAASFVAIAACGGGKHAVHFERPPLAGAKRAATPDAEFRAKAPLHEAEPVVVVPAVVDTRLANGVRVLVVERHEFPVVSLRVVSNVGSLDAKSLAVADVHARTLFDGTSTTKAEQVSRIFRAHGVAYDAFATFGSTFVREEVLAADLRRAVEILGEVLHDPAFENLEIRRRSAIRAVAARQRDPNSTLWSAFAASLGVKLTATKGEYAAVTQADLEAHHRDVFLADHVTIVVVGDVEAAKVPPLLAANFGWMKPGVSASTAPWPYDANKKPTGSRIHIVDHVGDPQAVIGAFWMGPTPTVENILESTVAVQLLRSRLYDDLRFENGFTYAVQAGSAHDARGPSPILLRSAVDVDHAGESVAELFAQIDALASSPPTETSMISARRRALAGLATSFDTADSTAELEASFALLGFPSAELSSWPGKIAKLQTDAVAAVTKSKLTLDGCRVVIVGDAKPLKKQLDALGLSDVEVETESP